MFAKVKSPVFIDYLVVELLQRNFSIFKAVLKDENGSICSALETNPVQDQRFIEWKGLNDLPYGVYTLEVQQGDDEMQMRLIKRV